MSYKNKYIIVKNLAEKPNNGGIPANDNKLKNIIIAKKLPLLKNFISDKVFTFFKSKRKKTKKIIISVDK